LTTAGLALTALLLILIPVVHVVRSRMDVAKLNSPDLTYADLDHFPSDYGFTEVLSDLLTPVALLSFGLFVVWLYTARRNLDGFADTRTRWGWGWTVAAWLVPVVNLFAPAAVIADTARESWWAQTGRRPRWVGGLVWLGWLAVLTTLGAAGYASLTRPKPQIFSFAFIASSPSDRVTPELRKSFARLVKPYDPPLLDVTVETLLVGIAVGVVVLVWLVTIAQHTRAARETA
jgi:hypothetical protein